MTRTASVARANSAPHSCTRAVSCSVSTPGDIWTHIRRGRRCAFWRSGSAWAVPERGRVPDMRAVSLFSGAGGFELGFVRAGIETVLQAESDPVCLSVLERHWPDVGRARDVRQVDAASLQGRARDVARAGHSADAERLRRTGGRGLDASAVDLVYGGFPCQDLSVARQAGRSWGRAQRSLA